jgi:hypothetical protein
METLTNGTSLASYASPPNLVDSGSQIPLIAHLACGQGGRGERDYKRDCNSKIAWLERQAAQRAGGS